MRCRSILALISVIAAFIMLTFACSAEFGTDELYGALPEDTREILDESGITPDGGIEKLGITEVWDKITALVTEHAEKPVRMLAAVTAVVLLSSLLASLSDAAGGMKSVYGLVTSLSSAAVITAYLAGMTETAKAAFGGASDFMLTYIPVLAGVAALDGHTASAAGFSATALITIQILSRFISAAVIPLSTCMIGISAAGSIDPDLKLDRLCEGIKKLVVWGLGLIMTLFLGFLSVQTIITASADNAALKTVKFAVSSSVPIVGGAVSEALSAVSGSISLLKTGIGGFGIAAGVCMMLPPVISALIFRFALFLSGVLCDLFGCEPAGKIIKSGENVMSVILAALACMMIFIVVSSAVLLAFCRS